MKPDVKQAVLAMLGPDGDRGSIESLIDSIDARHRYASAADRTVAAYTRGRDGDGLIDLMRTRRNDADDALSTRAIRKHDQLAAFLWLYGVERAWWPGHPDMIATLRGKCGLGTPKPEAKDMANASPDAKRPTRRAVAAEYRKIDAALRFVATLDMDGRKTAATRVAEEALREIDWGVIVRDAGAEYQRAVRRGEDAEARAALLVLEAVLRFADAGAITFAEGALS